MSIFNTRPRYVLLFSSCVILVIILLSSFAAPILINKVKLIPEITTQFNFPRYLSDTEIAGPPQIQKKPRYSFIWTVPEKLGRDTNWAQLLDNGPYDVIIISDSFLGATPAGKYLCQKISADNHVSILHIYTNYFEYSGGNTFQMLILLTNNGFLKKTGARVVILEDAERGLPDTILKSNLNSSAPVPSLPAGGNRISTQRTREDKPLTGSVLTAINESIGSIDNHFADNSRDLTTLKTWIKNDILSEIGSQSDDGTLYFVTINESRFTSPFYSSRLIFHRDDLAVFRNSNATCPDDYIRLNNNLNTVAKKLDDQNITLIFIPAVSAYNTYYPYIIDPPTVRSPLFDILRVLNRSYILVDTKTIADKLQQKGEKDLSGVGDPAHWTWRLTDAVAQAIDLSAKPPSPLRTAPIDRDEYNRAVQAFRAVIYERGEPDDPWAFKMDGLIYERANDSQNATRCYLRSLELDPQQRDLRVRLQNLNNFIAEKDRQVFQN